MKWASTAGFAFAILFCLGCSKNNETIKDRFVDQITQDMLKCYVALSEGDKKIKTIERQQLADIMIFRFIFLTSEEPYLESQYQISEVRKACETVAVLLTLGFCKEVHWNDRVYIGPNGEKETLRQHVDKHIQRIPSDELKMMTEKVTKLWMK